MIKKALFILAAFCNMLMINSQELLLSEQINASSISIDQEKNILVIGSLYGTFDFDFSSNKAELTSTDGGAYSDHFIASYDSLLNYRWAFSFFGAISGGNNSILTDENGHIYVSDYAFKGVDFDPSTATAFIENMSEDYGPFIVKYDNLGNFIWVKPHECKLIKVIGQHLYGFHNSRMIKYDTNGQIIWEKDFGNYSEPVLYGDKFFAIKATDEYSPGELAVFTMDTAGNTELYKVLARSENSSFAFGNTNSNPLSFVNDKMVVGARYWGDVDMDPGVDSVMIHNHEMYPIYHQGEYQLDVPALKHFVAVYCLDGTLLEFKEYGRTNPNPLLFKQDHQGNIFSMGIFYDSINLGMTNNEEAYLFADAHASYLAEYDSSFHFISAVKLSETERNFNQNYPLFKELYLDEWRTIIIGRYENLHLNHHMNFTLEEPLNYIAIYKNFKVPHLGESRFERSESLFSIYPVPAGDQITIEPSETVQEYSVILYSVSGQLLMTPSQNDNQNQLSLEGLPSGVYFLQLKTAFKTETKKIIKN